MLHAYPANPLDLTLEGSYGSFPVRFVLVALAIGWAVDLLFFKQPLGFDFLLWVMLVTQRAFSWSSAEKTGVWKLDPQRIVLAAGALPFLRMDGIARVAGFCWRWLASGFSPPPGYSPHRQLAAHRIVDWVSMVFRLIGAAFGCPPELFRPAEGEEPSLPVDL